MKKTYSPPHVKEIRFAPDNVLLAGSLSPDGSDNIGINPDGTEFGGEFQSERHGWNSSNWSSADDE